VTYKKQERNRRPHSEEEVAQAAKDGLNWAQRTLLLAFAAIGIRITVALVQTLLYLLS
jgi:hypothetical protein